ncbi:hypothetical protein DEO72_LG6g562 [Vigna unguiculata]|uniref:Uncharacterized protein n=1 Tax=Vigna unguiculata TaxID=3917 RepID=A0A4D6M3Z6_VIGUN|nr:hypothetical protein DEO72_LG6g562 [Vigna unguiculata]
MAKQRNLHSLVDQENLAHLLPSTESMIIARKKNHIQGNHTTNRGPWDYVPTTEAQPRRSLLIQSYSTKTDHSGTNIHSNTAQSHPAPRSGEPPPRLGESTKNKCVGNAGSRLSEIPLAWASCLLAQKPQQDLCTETRGTVALEPDSQAGTASQTNQYKFLTNVGTLAGVKDGCGSRQERLTGQAISRWTSFQVKSSQTLEIARQGYSLGEFLIERII